VPPGSFPQLQMDGSNLMTMPIDTGDNNIVSAAVVPCNGGYAIPVVPYNGGYCIPAVAVNGQGPGSRTVCGGMEASQAPCPNDMGRLGANAQTTMNSQDDDGMINEIDLTFGNKFRQCSAGNRQTSAMTESTWLPSENSRQISAVSDASWSSSGQFGSNFHQTAWSKDGPAQQKGRDGDHWTTTTVTKQQNGFDPASTTAPYGGHHNQMPEQVQNMLLQRSQGAVWNMESQSNGSLPLPPGMLQAPQMADTGSTPEAAPFLNAGAGQSEAQLAQIVELFGALKGNRAVQKQMSRSAQKEKSSKQANDPMSWDAGVVTVMMRQVPRQYSQLMLLKEVNQRGFQGLYDFLYLPFDLKKGINVGYGFVSFVHPQHALEFRKAFEGTYLDSHSHSNTRGKPVHVHPASLQGYEANCSHFMTTKTGQKQDPQFSPLFFPQGQPVDAATASQLGGGFFAAHQAALVSRQEQKLDKELRDASPGNCQVCKGSLTTQQNFCAGCGERVQGAQPNRVHPQRGYKGSARK